ncbi:hypothetical protein [Arthrobacter cupressi]|nr:hypothetical protein [Arthrobacter cupressi]NYD78177.1 hypothetical protein [Arthrobacter cupressi]
MGVHGLAQICHLYEECDPAPPGFAPIPGWVGDEEDQRIHSAARFGAPGDAWATIVTAQLGEEPFLAGLLSRLIPFLPKPELDHFSTFLQLRVCSPTFKERDTRFLVAGRHLALIQEKFDMEAVSHYFERRIQENPRRKLSARYLDWEKYFHLYDPDDD